MLNSIAINVAEKQTSKKTLTTKNKIKTKNKQSPPKNNQAKKKNPKHQKQTNKKNPNTQTLVKLIMWHARPVQTEKDFLFFSQIPQVTQSCDTEDQEYKSRLLCVFSKFIMKLKADCSKNWSKRQN